MTVYEVTIKIGGSTVIRKLAKTKERAEDYLESLGTSKVLEKAGALDSAYEEAVDYVLCNSKAANVSVDIKINIQPREVLE